MTDIVDCRGNLIKVGDKVRVVRPDPEYGLACILNSTDLSHEVTEVALPHLYIKPNPRIPLMPEGSIPIGPEEVEVVKE
jgi:hypothetical protein